MVDTFQPLQLTREALEIEDPTYAYSWQTERHPEHPVGSNGSGDGLIDSH